MNEIVIEGLGKTFHTKDGTVEALKNVNLTIKKGDICGIIGMSGAGKSTLAAKTYVNIIAVKEGNEDDKGIKALVEALHSDEVKDFINDKYDGAVIPYTE